MEPYINFLSGLSSQIFSTKGGLLLAIDASFEDRFSCVWAWEQEMTSPTDAQEHRLMANYTAH
jgi:hypothetical protein